MAVAEAPSVVSPERVPRPTAVVLDRYSLWLDTVVRIAEAAGVEVVGATTLVEEATELLVERRPDLFVVGLEKTTTDVVDTLMRAATGAGTTTIVVSSDDSPQFARHCLEAGADAYVVKTIEPNGLFSTIRQAIDRCVYLFGQPMTDRPAAAERVDGEREALTAREVEVLRLIAEGLSNADVARRLWISVPTVKYHLSRTYEKIGVSNRTGATRWALRHGLLAIDDAVA
ncbi:MAG TPA: response regulator transcription factor [Gaiellaceae bacterium]|nr:response regulator transcription factor [Gaiellaceae bacterium]